MSIIVRLSANDGIFSKGIRFMTWCKFSHVDFLLEDGNYLGALPFPGVCIHGSHYPVEEFFEFKGDDETIVKILGYARQQIGKHYDYSGIVGFAIRRNWQKEDKWFCSELVAASFNNNGVKIFDDNAYKISPRDIAINPLFTKIEKPIYAK